MTRLFILVTLIIGVVLIVSCSSAAAQPTATTQPTTASVQSTATVQPTTASAQSTATTQPTTASAQSTATTQPTTVAAQPTATTQPTTVAKQPITQTPTGGQQKLNLDDYFPKGAGRDLVLRDCTTCHSFVPVITGQRTNDRWLSLKKDHKDKASGVSEADYNTEFAYLMENFNNTKPEPKLPDWFIQQQPGVGE